MELIENAGRGKDFFQIKNGKGKDFLLIQTQFSHKGKGFYG